MVVLAHQFAFENKNSAGCSGGTIRQYLVCHPVGPVGDQRPAAGPRRFERSDDVVVHLSTFSLTSDNTSSCHSSFVMMISQRLLNPPWQMQGVA